MALVVCADDSSLFGPDEKEMNKVLKEFELDGFELKTEKEAKDVFLGMSATQTEDEKGLKTVKLTQLGLIKKFLECVKMVNCNASGTPSLVQPPLCTEAFPCQHDNVNERKRKDIMGPQCDNIILTSKLG